MIRIKKKFAKELKLSIDGHANMADYGEDIVCSGVSVLAINTVNSLRYLLNLNENQLRVIEGDGFIKITVFTDILDERTHEDALLLMNAFCLGAKAIAESYPEAVEFEECLQ